MPAPKGPEKTACITPLVPPPGNGVKTPVHTPLVSTGVAPKAREKKGEEQVEEPEVEEQEENKDRVILVMSVVVVTDPEEE